MLKAHHKRALMMALHVVYREHAASVRKRPELTRKTYDMWASSLPYLDTDGLQEIDNRSEQEMYVCSRFRDTTLEKPHCAVRPT